MIPKEKRDEWRRKLDEGKNSADILSELSIAAVPALLAEVERLERLIDNSENANVDDLVDELWKTGKANDCDNASCHSPMGYGPACLRHEIAHLKHRVDEAEKWSKRYRSLWEECKEGNK